MKTCGNCGETITGESFHYDGFDVCRPCEDAFRDGQAQFLAELAEAQFEPEECDPVEVEPDDLIEEPILDDEEAFASAGHGLDESYQPDTPLADVYDGE